MSEGVFEPVATVGELADGDILPIEIGGEKLVLCRSGDDYYALQRRCIHQGADLAEGIVSRGTIVCAMHGWRFQLANGQHELSAETCLISYPVRVDGDRILVRSTPRPYGG